VWGSENPQVACEHERDSPKVNVFCAISNKKVYGPFFIDNTVTEMSYVDMLRNYMMPQLHEDSRDFIFQQDGARLLTSTWMCAITRMPISHNDGLDVLRMQTCLCSDDPAGRRI
jgi:hypothetical protein